MAEPYNIYDALQDRGSVSRLSFPGYVSTAAPPLASHSIPVSTEFPGACSDFLQRDFLAVDKSIAAGIIWFEWLFWCWVSS